MTGGGGTQSAYLTRRFCPSCQSVAVRRNCSHPQISGFLALVSFPQEGRFAVVTDVGSGMRWTRRVIRRMTLQADGEVVWFWRSDAGAKVAGLNESDDRRWQPSMVTGKSTKDPVKTIAQGMPAVAVYL
jgi:hypothetical protein